LLKALWLTQKIQKRIFDIVLRIQNQQKSQRTLSIMASYKVNIPAGPLWSNDEAQKLGPQIAASYGAEFTGQWQTIVEGVMSVIEIKYTF
jgi:hypothetical protein